MPAKPLQVHVLALTDCTPMVSVGVLEVLRKSLILAEVPGVPPSVDVKLVSAGAERTVRASGGLEIACDMRLRDVHASALVVVPSLDPDIVAHLALNAAVVPALKRLAARGADVMAACTGSFLVAEAGLLDGKAATTHWAFQDLFHARYPSVRLERAAIIVDQGRIITAGGATAYLNLALYIVEKLLGPEVARLAAKMFLVDTHKAPQSAYALFSPQKTHGDDDVLRAQQLIEGRLARALSVDDLARAVGISRRHFVRRFTRATGNPPSEYIQRVRVEAAKRLLETTPRSVATITRAVGYEDVVAFRRMFVRWTGLTQGEYRARYGLMARRVIPLERIRSDQTDIL